jgi:hypothetical protein
MKWINIKEKQPEKGQKVLVYGYPKGLWGTFDNKIVALAYWESSNNSYDSVDTDVEYTGITHWALIPPAPKN